MRLQYVTVDVFTEQRFGGNQLAVVLDAQGLSPAQMQSIASEFNYSETTFVLPPDEQAHTARVRIFTPRVEVPFAGHPNVGTAFVLARRAAPPIGGPLVFEETAGLVPLEILRRNGEVIGAELEAPEPLSRRSVVAAAEVAACLGLEQADVRCDRHEPQVLSVGLPFLVAELASREALRRARPNVAAFARVLPLDGADAIYFYTRERSPEESDCDLAARMFAPFDGLVEDPATGSATAALVAALAEGSPDADGELRLRVLQGSDMGRPSLLMARATRRGRRVAKPTVAGHCVEVMQGLLTL